MRLIGSLTAEVMRNREEFSAGGERRRTPRHVASGFNPRRPSEATCCSSFAGNSFLRSSHRCMPMWCRPLTIDPVLFPCLPAAFETNRRTCRDREEGRPSKRRLRSQKSPRIHALSRQLQPGAFSGDSPFRHRLRCVRSKACQQSGQIPETSSYHQVPSHVNSDRQALPHPNVSARYLRYLGCAAMKSNRPIMESTNGAAPTAPAHAPCYTGPAPLKEVMFEQLDYLMAHNCGTRASACPECARLEHIRFWLLAPFRGGVS